MRGGVPERDPDHEHREHESRILPSDVREQGLRASRKPRPPQRVKLTGALRAVQCRQPLTRPQGSCPEAASERTPRSTMILPWMMASASPGRMGGWRRRTPGHAARRIDPQLIADKRFMIARCLEHGPLGGVFVVAPSISRDRLRDALAPSSSVATAFITKVPAPRELAERVWRGVLSPSDMGFAVELDADDGASGSLADALMATVAGTTNVSPFAGTEDHGGRKFRRRWVGRRRKLSAACQSGRPLSDGQPAHSRGGRGVGDAGDGDTYVHCVADVDLVLPSSIQFAPSTERKASNSAPFARGVSSRSQSREMTDCSASASVSVRYRNECPSRLAATANA